MNKYIHYLGYIGFLAIIVSCFIPWTTIMLNNTIAATNYFSETNGQLVLICAIIGLLMVIIKKSKVVFFPLTIIIIIIASDLSNGLTVKVSYDNLAIGQGVYLLLIGITLCFFYGLFYKEKKIKEEIDFNIKESSKKISKKENDYIYCPKCGIRLPKETKTCHVCRYFFK